MSLIDVSPKFLGEFRKIASKFEKDEIRWKPEFDIHKNKDGTEVARWIVTATDGDKHGEVCEAGYCTNFSQYFACKEGKEDIVEYIANACPENILEMISEIESLRRTNSLLEDTILLLKERERGRKI